MKLFTQEDFNEYVEFDDQAKACANFVNEKLANLVRVAPTVYTYDGKPDAVGITWNLKRFWGDLPVTATYEAKLLFIKEAPKIPCKHEPCNPFDGAYKCRHCGVAIIATWTSQSSYK